MDYYKKDMKEVFSAFDSSKEGLSSSEAEKRLRREGLNELKTEVKVNVFKIFFSQFKGFLIYILLFAVAVSLLLGFTVDHERFVDAAIIFAILLINALIGFFEELSAQRSLEALRRLTFIKVKVLRDGKIVSIDSKSLVRGDVVLLEPGDKVPADCRVFESFSLMVDESTLTGESVPVHKESEVIYQDKEKKNFKVKFGLSLFFLKKSY